ncbi:MAG: hypothetical protein DIU79_04745 [Actinobacteria bacterium]|nr:MAG: hypothetical protein DIU79_04745 [Actinomycetota bacterium]
MSDANPRLSETDILHGEEEAELPRRTGLRDLLARLTSTWMSRISLTVLLLFLLMAVFGPMVAPYDPAAMGKDVLQGPSLQHWMGTDDFGRDVFSRFLQGTRVSIFVGLAAVAIACFLGTIAGMTAGFTSGRIWDGLIMRSMDIILAFPLLVLVPVITGVFGKSGIAIGPIRLSTIPLMTLAISLVFVPIFARVARSSVLAEMEEEYIIAARTFGARRRHILLNNVLPNIAAPLVVQAAFAFGSAVVVEAAVSFLGLGVQPPNASWGTLLADGRTYLTLGCWWLVVFPALALALAVLSFNLLGDDLRDHLDPRVRSSVRKISRSELTKP